MHNPPTTAPWSRHLKLVHRVCLWIVFPVLMGLASLGALTLVVVAQATGTLAGSPLQVFGAGLLGGLFILLLINPPKIFRKSRKTCDKAAAKTG